MTVQGDGKQNEQKLKVEKNLLNPKKMCHLPPAISSEKMADEDVDEDESENEDEDEEKQE